MKCLSFIYNGKSTDDFGVIVGSLDGGNQSQDLGMRRTIVSDRSPNQSIDVIFGSKYEERLSFSLTLLKKENSYFTDAEIRSLNRWLIGYQFPKKLTINNDLRQGQEVYYKCLFTSVTQQRLSGVAALTYEIICDSPFGYEDFSSIYEITQTKQNINFYNWSDEIDDYFYPTIKITKHGNGDFSLSHTEDINNVVILSNLIDGEVITIDCLNQIIKSTVNTFTSTLGGQDNFSHRWIRLLPNDNSFIVNGNCELEISGSYPRKVGI